MVSLWFIFADSVSLVFAGDINFSDPVRSDVKQHLYSYKDTLSKVTRYIREADIAFGNLESPFVPKRALSKKNNGAKLIFLDAEKQSSSALRFAGFDVMTLANNHLNDYGDLPVNYTVDALKEVGIKTVGVTHGPYNSNQVPLILETGALRIGVLAYCITQGGGRSKNCSEVRRMFQSGPAVYQKEIATKDVNNLKNDDKLQVQNYRPISVLPAISKVIERVVHAQLSLYLDQLGYLYKHQYGFRRGHSTQQAIAQINNWVLESMDSGEVTGLLFLDISKAFDSLNHKVLLGKLESIGLSSKSVSWFRSYLVGRRQCVLINGDYPITALSLTEFHRGVFWALCYLTYMSNSVEKAWVTLYADDAVLSCAASTAVELQAILARELNQICEWYSANRLTINAKKTQLMLAGSKTKLSSFDDVELQMKNAKVERVQ
ncbi:hypothetical protein ACROYT_G004653 [Oculina patagonica]